MAAPKLSEDPSSTHLVPDGSEFAESQPLESSKFDQKASRALIRKVDLVLLPFLSLLYLLSFLDRSNIGNARLAGLEKDLKMKGLDYNVALAIFFPFYVLAEIPSNMMMKLSRPSVWIPSIMVAWGTMCCLMGVVQSYAGLLAIRAALGLAEGGLFPGVTFYITMWYRRHECGLRMAIFFSAATAAGAFGGLLARGIVEMDGLRELSGWAWIFIIEGVVTVAVAIAAFFFMHDYPDTAKFLTEAERHEIQRRLETDRALLVDEYRHRYAWDAVRDWKIWVYSIITIGIFTPLYSFSLFLPSIIKGLGYTNNAAQLITVPPYVVACVFCISAGWFADRHGQRGIYIIGFNIMAIIGFALQLGSSNLHVKYAGTFFAASGIYPNVPQIVAWNGNNIGGSVKRAVGMAMQVGIGNLGGAIAGFMYLSRDAPGYHSGHGAMIALLGLSTILSIGMSFWFRKENARREVAGRGMELTGEDAQREAEKGDNAGFFRYTI